MFFGEPPPLPLLSSLEAELTAPGDSDRSSLTTLGAGCPPPPSAVTARGEEAWGLVGVAGAAAGPPPGREGATSSKTLRRAGSCRMSSALRSGAPSLRACEVFSLALRSGTSTQPLRVWSRLRNLPGGIWDLIRSTISLATAALSRLDALR